MTLLKCQNLGVQRGAQWLFRGLDFELGPREILAIVGPSGAGKTTLLRCLAKLDRPSAGCVDSAMTPSLVPQHLQLCQNLSASLNIAAGRLGKYSWWRTLAGLPKEDLIAADDLLARLGLGEIDDRPVRLLSGGEQRRVAVARALLHGSPLVLADEPVSMLDQENGRAVLEMMKNELFRHFGSLICVLHDESLAKAFATRTLRLGSFADKGWQLS